MIAGILSILGSSAIGTLLGGLFAFLNRKADIEAKRVDNDHEKNRWAHDAMMRDKDLEYAKEEAKGKLEVAIVESDAAIESSRMSAIAIAQTGDKITSAEIKAAGWWGWLLVWAEALNRLIRPVLTAVLAGAAIYINWLLIGKFVDMWPSMTPAQQHDAGMQAFAWITGQAGAVVGYWFISRGPTNAGKK